MTERGGAVFMSLLGSLHYTSLRFIADFQDGTESYMAIGLRKDSELRCNPPQKNLFSKQLVTHTYHRGAFDYHLLRMTQTGLLSEMTHRTVYGTRPKDASQRIFVAEASPLGYANLSFPALMLLAGAAAGMALSILERLVRGRSDMTPTHRAWRPSAGQ